MEDKVVTPEQKQAVQKLLKQHMAVNFFLFIKYTFFLWLSAFLTVMVNILYVKSDSFVFPTAIINFLFIMHYMLKESMAKRKEFNENLRKILYPEETK
jgi:hypothetical protein